MPAADPLQVLVVDNDPATAQMVGKHLATAGYEVLTAPNGVEALQVLLAKGPPIVITNRVMPEMDGLELCRAIRTHEGVSYTYVIIAARTKDDWVVEAFEAGADDCLARPVNPRELLARLRAGERIISLRTDLDGRTREVHRVNAEMAVAHTRLAEANEKLQQLATVDDLTGLANRREAMNHLAEYWAISARHGEPLACISLDIDHFKSFNDVYGHAVGDLVLKEVADVLRRTVRESDRVSRVGGEEFLVVCPHSIEAMAAIAAERLRRAVESLVIRSGELELGVTISLGAAERGPGMARPDDLLCAVDTALYAAKDAGRNRVCRVQTLQEAVASEGGPVSPEETGGPSRLAGVTDDESPTVLIVDDDSSVRAFGRRVLEPEGYRVMEAVDGHDALIQIEQDAPDVIVMDAVMPGMDGLECVRRLKADPSTESIPVVVASSRADAADIVSGLEAGADEYLTKPLNPKELALRVRTLARLRAAPTDSEAVRGEHAKALGALLGFSRRIAAEESLKPVLEAAVTIAGKLTRCRCVSIMLPDHEEAVLKLAKAIGIDDETAAGVRVPIGSGTIGSTYVSGRSTVVNTPENTAEPLHPGESPLLVSVPYVCEAFSTLGRIVGVLSVSGRHGGQPFSQAELDCLALVNAISASAIARISPAKRAMAPVTGS